MSNVKVQNSNEIQNSNFPKRFLGIWSFDIDLTFVFCHLNFSNLGGEI
jgi:hypothetical protein